VTSERSVLVAQACPAADRELFPKLAEFQAHVTDLGSRIGTLEGLLTEAFVALMRMAEEFSAAGGEPALMAARDHLNGLNTESRELRATLPDLEKRASTEAIRLVREAVRFDQAGGRDRLDVVIDEIANVGRDLEALRTLLPRLRVRRDAIPDIRAAAEFAGRGGHSGMAELIARIAQLTNARDLTVAAAGVAREEATKKAEAARTAEQELARAREFLADWRRTLTAAQSYIDAGGLSFDGTYEEQLIALEQEEERQHQRSQFRLTMAANALKAEREGLGTGSLEGKRRDLVEAIAAADRRIDELEGAISDLSNQINAADGYARRVDKVVTSIMDSW